MEKEKQEKLLKDKSKKGKLKFYFYPNGKVYLTGKNVVDNDDLLVYSIKCLISRMQENNVCMPWVKKEILSHEAFKGMGEDNNNKKEEKPIAKSPAELVDEKVNKILGKPNMAQSEQASDVSYKPVDNNQ